VPLDTSFRDETGQTHSLHDYLDGRPAILVLVYYNCPMLCNLELNALANSVRVLPLQFGDDYRIIAISVDPHEDATLAASKKQNYVREIGKSTTSTGWRFLTGNQPQIDAVCKSVGFRYKYDVQSGQYSHAAALMILTPDGRIARYFAGLDYPARELR